MSFSQNIFKVPPEDLNLDSPSISPTPDDFDDSSNSSTEKRKKRPLRNRESDVKKESRKSSENRLLGVAIGELKERCDQG